MDVQEFPLSAKEEEMKPIRMWLMLDLHFSLMFLLPRWTYSTPIISPLQLYHVPPLQKCPAHDKPMQSSRQSKLFCSRWASWISVLHNVTSSRRCVVENTAQHSSAQRGGTWWPFPMPGCHINSAPTSHPGTAMGVSPRTAEVNDDWMQ